MMKRLLATLMILGFAVSAPAQTIRIHDYAVPIAVGGTAGSEEFKKVNGILYGLKVTVPDLTGTPTVTVDLRDEANAVWWTLGSIAEDQATVIQPSDATEWTAGEPMAISTSQGKWIVRAETTAAAGSQETATTIDVRLLVGR